MKNTSDRDELTFVLYALRYSLGRQTAAPTEVSEAIRNHWAEMAPATKKLVLRDLKAEIDRDDRCRELMGQRSALPLGMDCDRETWLELYEAISRDATQT